MALRSAPEMVTVPELVGTGAADWEAAPGGGGGTWVSSPGGGTTPGGLPVSVGGYQGASVGGGRTPGGHREDVMVGTAFLSPVSFY